MPYTKTHGVIPTIIFAILGSILVRGAILHFMFDWDILRTIYSYFQGLVFQSTTYGIIGVYFSIIVCLMIGNSLFIRTVRYTDWGQCTSCGTKFTLKANNRCPRCGSDIYTLY